MSRIRAERLILRAGALSEEEARRLAALISEGLSEQGSAGAGKVERLRAVVRGAESGDVETMAKAAIAETLALLARVS